MMRLIFYFSVSLILHIFVLAKTFEMASDSSKINSPANSAKKIHVHFSPRSRSDDLQARQDNASPGLREENNAPQVENSSITEAKNGIYLDVYHHRQELTRQPQLAKNIDLSSLASFFLTPDDSVIAELYINNQGNIDRVDIALNNLPPETIETLQKLLSQLQFSAGEIEGRAVKTRIKIEVMLHLENPNSH